MAMTLTDRLDLTAKIHELTASVAADDVISLLLAIAAARAIQPAPVDACAGGVVMCPACFETKATELYTAVQERWSSMLQGTHAH